MPQAYQTPLVQSIHDGFLSDATDSEQVQTSLGAQRVLDAIRGEKDYSCGELSDRRTGRADGVWNADPIRGRYVREDLLHLIDDLSHHTPLPVTQVAEPVWTSAELAERFHVSTKTITRWRRNGLVGRRLLINGRKRVGFLESSVQQFVAAHRQLVARAGRFRHFTAEDRRGIATLYRQHVDGGAAHAEALRATSSTVRCSIETVRQVVKHARLELVEQLPLEYVASDEFAAPGAQRSILGEPPGNQPAARREPPPQGLPAYLASLYETPLLQPEMERYLFRKFNYLKYGASQLRQQLETRNPDLAAIDEIERLYALAVETKNQIIRANLRLVVSLAKGRVSETHDFYTLVSDGNMSLMRAVEKFDYSRGFKFSTYATWAIIKNYARSIPEEIKRRRRMSGLHDDLLGSVQDSGVDHRDGERDYRRNAHEVGRLMAYLSEREQCIITRRFGLDYRREPQTLREIGEELGVTKERVRQLQSRALRKLRDAAKREHIEALEVH